VVKRAVDRGARSTLLVFDAHTSERIDLDVHLSDAELVRQVARPATRGPGRPKLGVIPREVTLLPRHWDWLAEQPGGASAALRRLVDAARKTSGETDRVRKAREAAYRFISAMAGDREGFEEASRALFAGDQARFRKVIDKWPADIRAHARELMSRTAS
jgi:hypothetical protein